MKIFLPLFFFQFIASCLSASVLGQNIDAKNAKILKEQRFDAGDGRFGAAFAQEDGTVFREETTADGERIGQYSYIDQDGKTITVRYSAGKDGFRILEGSHIPEGATGLQSAPFDPEIAAAEQLPEQPAAAPVRQQPAQVRQRPAPVRQQPAPVRQQPAPVRQQQAPVRQQPAPVRQQQQFQPQTVPQSQQTGDFNPFINPADSSHLNFQLNTNAAQFQSQGQAAPRQQVVQQQPRQQFVQQQRQQVVQQQPRQQFAQQQPRQQFVQQQPRQQFVEQARQQFAPQPRQQQQVVPNPNSVPACANCEGVNPFINPADSSHSQLFTSRQQQPLQPAFSTQQQQPASTFRQPASTFIPQQQQQQPAQQTPPNPSFSFQQRTQTQQQPIQPAFSTPTFRQPQQQQPSFRQPQQPPPSFRQPQEQSPNTLNNFQGNLNLNRFDTGFNFDFSS